MTKLEIFENLIEPLKSELKKDAWEFLLKRGEIFINQTASLSTDESKGEISELAMYPKNASQSSPLPVSEEKTAEEIKEVLIKFKKWYDKLSPASKCTVHPPAGSGGSYGLYNMSDEDLIDSYIRKSELARRRK